MAQVPLRKQRHAVELHIVDPELEVLLNLEGQRDRTVRFRQDDRNDLVVGVSLVGVEFAKVLRTLAQRLVVQDSPFGHGDLLAQFRRRKFHVPPEVDLLHAGFHPEFERDPNLVSGEVLHLRSHVGEITGLIEPLYIGVERLAPELRAGTQLDVEGDLFVGKPLRPLLVEPDLRHLRRPRSRPAKDEDRQRPAESFCEFHVPELL
ncbi:hypothetical protein SDC9_135111 [bioreactor metagenome]|uniref:Uncharacterized protein n=1 Tax=bioreactor metagenome TaxID=1076179 RepID=A0A645DEV3_9ZZZZ